MQFVKGGPDIPERLLQAHEDGGVIFFCGAGVSCPAGLPSFDGLVKRLYSDLEITPNAVQRAAIKARQFDTAVDLLEAGIIGGRETVGPTLVKILTPDDFSAPKATATHEALLVLGRNLEGRTRLVTTNFDRLFEAVISAKGLSVERFRAPLLPVPKNRWDGLVYLHGLLTDTPTQNDLDRLVVSSGDFGLAYLIERWAARFVSELFRNYIVCFIGYSINDPVMRYMMDAHAADRRHGDSSHEMFALGSYSKGKEDQRANEWLAKNVTPILYREHNRHAYLHKTLCAWAETYRVGVRGKEHIVVEYAMARPLASTGQDNFVGRLLWALSDPSGLPAKRFAEWNPVPSLDWLEPLCKNRYYQADLNRFGVPPRAVKDDKLTFSLTCRPSPYNCAPWMVLIDAGVHRSRWDQVMRQLARWLIRYLDDPTLLLWMVKHGGQLHDELAWNIEQRLAELAKLEHDGNSDELDRIRANAPSAIPRSLMRTLWRLLLTGRVRSGGQQPDFFRWRDRFKQDGLTSALRFSLREMLTPRVSLSEPIPWPYDNGNSHKSERIKDLVEWNIVLSSDCVHYSLRDLTNDERWTAALPRLLANFSDLLHDALDLMHELGGAENKSDLSYIYQPSISKHPQNRDIRDWTALINLSRDAWLATAAQDPEMAQLAAKAWWQVPYPLFRRLAFFAAAQDHIIPHRLALDWLLATDHWWLWSVETEREAMRLLVALAPKLNAAELTELEQAILAGPPRAMFKDDIEAEDWVRIVEREVWLRLAKMNATDAILGANATTRLDALSARYPQWQLDVDERDGFPIHYWGGDGKEWRMFVSTPHCRRELIVWLKQHPAMDYWQKDDWRQRCRDNFPTTTCALYALAKTGDWPTDRWQEALQAWSEEKLIKRSWHYMAPVLADAPDDLLQSLAHMVSWWLQAVSKTFDGHELLFFALAQRILELDQQEGVDNDEPVTLAINHPIGHVTEALLNWWYRSLPEDGQRLPDKLRSVLSEICNTQIEKYRHGRVLLSAHVIALFRVDRDWAMQHLVPLFDWQRSKVEARAAWDGFLWSPRLFRPLMEVLKHAFLDTARHYETLGEHGRQYAALLTFSALDRGDTFTTAELASATRALPQKGLQETARALVQALEGAGDQRIDYWKNRVVPYLHAIWPKTRDNVSPSIAESLGLLCIAAGDAFPEALKQTQVWLQPLEDPNQLVHQLNESGICRRFSELALGFLDHVIGSRTQWITSELSSCLESIRAAVPDLAKDDRFRKLVDCARQRGIELK